MIFLTIYTGLTLVVAISSIVATVYAKRSADAAKSAAITAHQALNDSKSNFIAEQRPILWLTDDIGAPQVFKNPHDPTSGQLLWTWHFTNYGKTPPQDFRFKQYFKLGSAAPVQSHGELAESIGAPIPPGKKDFATVVSDPMKLIAINDLISKGQVRILIVMNYTDITQKAYETGICLERTNAGSIAYCKEGDYIH